MKRPRRPGATFLLFAASCGACLAVVEGAARVVAWRLRGRARTQRSLLEYDPDLGWRKTSGDEETLHGEGAPVRLRTNAHGLRGPEIGYEKGPDVLRVLLLGDSFAEGAAVAEDATVEAGLARLLDRRECGRYEVLNGGTSGYSTDQEYLFFEREGARYSPDVVALLFFSNDLQGNTSPHRKPWFELDGDRLVLRGAPVPPPPPGHLHRPPDPPARLTPWRGSEALRLLGMRTERSNPSLHRWLAEAGLVEQARDHPPTRDWLGAYGPETDKSLRRWRVTRALLAALEASVTRHGARFLVVYVPAGFEVDEDDWRRTRERWGLDGEGWDRDRVARQLGGVCGALGVSLVDLTGALRESQRSGRRPYFREDPHWNETGHAVAARELARAVGWPCAPDHQHASRAPVR